MVHKCRLDTSLYKQLCRAAIAQRYSPTEQAASLFPMAPSATYNLCPTLLQATICCCAVGSISFCRLPETDSICRSQVATSACSHPGGGDWQWASGSEAAQVRDSQSRGPVWHR